MTEENTKKEYTPVQVTLESLLAAGAHFGHKAENWNPQMLPYIYGKRNNVYVINLDLTVDYWRKAQEAVKKAASEGKTFLFVGTKDQAREAVQEAAERCGAFYINYRWLGGALTNFETIKKSINRMSKMESLLEKAEDPESDIKLGKKERLEIRRKLEKLSVNLGGIRDMKRPPDVIFIVDINKDSIAVQEAKRLHIPIVALIDTNTDPMLVDYKIPSNDDSKRAISLFANAVSDAVVAGRKLQKKAAPKSKDSAAKKSTAKKATEDEAVATEEVVSEVTEEAPAPQAT